MRVSAAFVLGLIGWAALVPASGAFGAGVVLDERSCWQQYLRFAPNRFSPALLKAGGAAAIDRQAYKRLRIQSENTMRADGLDPGAVDWRDHAVLAPRGYRAFNPFLMPPPPENWTAVDFDDAAWVRVRAPFQGGSAAEITRENLGQYNESGDLKLFQAFYRGRFVVADPASAGPLTLQLAYNGGARVFLNGREIARGHLPAGPLDDQTPAEDYPAYAYAPGSQSVKPRTIGPVAIAPDRLRAGVNALAVEIRASCFHPVVFRNPIQPNWGGPQRPFPHARLVSLQLRSNTGAVASVNRRPAGMHVWVEDVHRRMLSSDFLAAGPGPGTVRFVGARNGTYSAQIVVGTDRRLGGVRLRPGALTRTDGPGVIPASAIEAAPMMPFPAADWSMRRVGDERGLDAWFPTRAQLAGYEGQVRPGRGFLYDRIGAPSAAPVAVPAGTSRPLWLRLRIPPDTPAGRYRGTVELAAAGTPPASLAVTAEVLDWTLPAPNDFATWVGCEENPYGVARQYGVKLWSDEHFKLLDASFRQLGRIGNDWLNVPVLAHTEFGNRNDSMIRWSPSRSGGWSFDYSVMDRYIDLAVKRCGQPRVIQFVVMHGMPSPREAPTVPRVPVRGPARTTLLDVPSTRRDVWTAFATSLEAHMKERGQAGAMVWGAPWEAEADPGLKNVLAECCPDVYWTAGPHEMMANGTYAKQQRFYHIVTDIRYQGGWPGFRDDMGWKSRTVHLLNPRPGGTVFALHTTSHPFAYRVMVDRALAMGRNGFTRVGADEWARIHYDGSVLYRWLTGIPVLFVLWPGPDGAEPGARFEALLEGLQEAEARIFLEKALDAGRLTGPAAARAKKVLAGHFNETNFCQGNSVIYSIEQNYYGWQERSRRLYATAARAARAMREDRR